MSLNGTTWTMRLKQRPNSSTIQIATTLAPFYCCLQQQSLQKTRRVSPSGCRAISSKQLEETAPPLGKSRLGALRRRYRCPRGLWQRVSFRPLMQVATEEEEAGLLSLCPRFARQLLGVKVASNYPRPLHLDSFPKSGAHRLQTIHHETGRVADNYAESKAKATASRRNRRTCWRVRLTSALFDAGGCGYRAKRVTSLLSKLSGMSMPPITPVVK
ncbi:unnamed protein product [Amoebophrya sp. A25]|nr:unnamed protein product [Amoebophrya sp. A25]|eukprot:GSA25T00002637001.1